MFNDLPDINQDGVPDVYENRRPITEILNDETIPCDPGIIIVELEKKQRCPQEGELYINAGEIHRATFNFTGFTALIVRRVLSGSLDDIQEV